VSSAPLGSMSRALCWLLERSLSLCGREVSIRGWVRRLHHCAFHVGYGYHALLFSIHGLGKETEGFLDLGFLARGDVVFFRELGLALTGRLARLRLGGGGSLNGLFVVSVVSRVRTK
jgi:hypothetical protein